MGTALNDLVQVHPHLAPPVVSRLGHGISHQSPFWPAIEHMRKHYLVHFAKRQWDPMRVHRQVMEHTHRMMVIHQHRLRIMPLAIAHPVMHPAALHKPVYHPFIPPAMLIAMEQQRLRVAMAQQATMLVAQQQIMMQEMALLTQAQKQLELFLKEQALAKKVLEKLRRDLARDPPDVIVAKLSDEHPLVRWLAIQIVAQNRFHAEKQLIDLLQDPIPRVREEAHQALVKLGRGTDFGPRSGASAQELRQAVARWTNWLDAQDQVSLAGTPPSD
jgi:hypothetical protein